MLSSAPSSPFQSSNSPLPSGHTLVDPQSDMPPNANVKILDHMGQRPKFKRSSSRGLISNGGIDTTNEWGTAEEAIGEAAKARRQSFYGIMSHPDLKEKDTFNKPKHGPWCKMKRIISKATTRTDSYLGRMLTENSQGHPFRRYPVHQTPSEAEESRCPEASRDVRFPGAPSRGTGQSRARG